MRVRDAVQAVPRIVSTPGGCGGEPCIVGLRVPAWLLVQARNLGMVETELRRAYPSLRAESLANAWVYYRGHREEVDAQIAENEAT